MYGEAPETVSGSTTTVAVATLNEPPEIGGIFVKSHFARYVICVVLITSCTKEDVLYGRLVLVP